MLALRGIVEVPAAAVDVAARPDGVVFSAVTGDGVRRSTAVAADPAPADVDADARTLRWSLALEPGEHASIRLHYALGGGEPRSRRARDAARGRAGAEAWLAERTRVRADDELFNRVVQRSLLDLRMLRSPLDGHDFHAAGVPWFATLFGRDSLITALEVLAFDPSVAEQTLRVLGERLGRRVDPWREEEPGKVLHELRVGEVAALRPRRRSRATTARSTRRRSSSRCSSSTPLARRPRRSSASCAGAVDAALGWIDRHGDHDGDGFLDYRASVPEGLRNQGWKDSEDGVLDGRRRPARAADRPRGGRRPTSCTPSGGSPTCSPATATRRRPRALEAQAASLEAALERFWIPERGFYGMALDGEGRLSTALASNQGHLLWAGAVPPERARGVRDALMGEAMFSGWGIRTLGLGEAGFNPVGYHLGTVWPHDTAMAAAGLRRYGFDEDFTEVFEALLEAASHAEAYRLPELFAGFSRDAVRDARPLSRRLPSAGLGGGGHPLPADERPGPAAGRAGAPAARAAPLAAPLGRPGGGRGPARRRRAGRPALRARRRGDHVALTDARIQGDLEVVLEISGSR